MNLQSVVLELLTATDQVSIPQTLQGVIAESATGIDQFGTFEFAEQLVIKLRSFTERRRF